MEIIKLNLIPSGATPVVHVKQYDIGRTWRFELYEGAAVYTLDGTEVLECDVKKLDGNIVTISVTNTSSTYVDIETTVQMTACSGEQIGALRITKGGDDIATINFILACQRSPLEGGITSDSAIHNLEQQIADAVAEQYDADSVIFDNAPTPGHGIGYAVTSDGVAAAVQDAKDYTDTAIGGLTIPENITDLQDTDINTPTDGEILVYNNGVWENQANPASTQNFAPDYDGTQTYNTNDKVIYQGLLYVCLNDNITGAWDGTKWQNISIADYTAELLPIESGSATNTKDYIDTGLSGKADTSDLPIWIKQEVGTSVSYAVPCTFFYYYADQWRAYVQFPFIAKNNNYSISLTSIQAENIGDITSKISVIAKYGACFEIETTKTMTALPNQFSVCVGTVNFTITFA